MKKDKIIGIILFILSLAMMYGTIISDSFYLAIFAIMVSIPLLKVSYKLLRYPSPIPVTMKEIAKSIKFRIIISFSGIDGSGKSTHARALKEKLDEIGIPCEIVWARWRPIITYPFMGLIYVLRRYRRKDYHKSRVLKKIWAYLTFLDFVYLYLFKLKPFLRKKGIIICDRYIYDHIVQLMYDRLYNERAAQLMFKLIPNLSLTFIFDIPEQVAKSRKGDTEKMLRIWKFENNIDEYLRKERETYLKVANSLNIPVIDATKDFEELHEEIYKQVLQAYTNKQR